MNNAKKWVKNSMVQTFLHRSKTLFRSTKRLPTGPRNKQTYESFFPESENLKKTKNSEVS